MPTYIKYSGYMNLDKTYLPFDQWKVWAHRKVCDKVKSIKASPGGVYARIVYFTDMIERLKAHGAPGAIIQHNEESRAALRVWVKDGEEAYRKLIFECYMNECAVKE